MPRRDPFEGLVPLKPLLYGVNAPFLELSRKDVPVVIGKVVKRKGRYATFRKEYVRIEDVERALSLLK